MAKTKKLKPLNDPAFKMLVGPFNMLIGYAKSARDLTPDSNIDGWKKRCVELAEQAEKAWEKAI